MIWRRWGLKDNPYASHEIDETTLDLFTGQGQEIKLLQNAFVRNKRIIFLEGDPGIGKTSLGNYWRYSSMQKRLCFTPYVEICLDQPLNFNFFICKVLEALSWSLPQSHPFISRDAEFKAYQKKSKELFELIKVSCVDEMPSDPEGCYLSDVKELFISFSQILSKLSYEYGLLIQVSFPELNNPIKSIFQKNLWELLVTEGVRWLLIGEPMLGERLYYHNSGILPDDLYKVSIKPLEIMQLHELLMRRKDYLALTQNSTLPLASDVIEHLYLLSAGNLKKIFQVSEKITVLLETHDSPSGINLKIAKSLITQYFQDEIRRRWNISQTSAEILSFLVKEDGLSPGAIAQRVRKLRPNVSRNLMYLKQTNLVRMEIKGRNRVYYPSMEAKIAFS